MKHLLIAVAFCIAGAPMATVASTETQVAECKFHFGETTQVSSARVFDRGPNLPQRAEAQVLSEDGEQKIENPAVASSKLSREEAIEASLQEIFNPSAFKRMESVQIYQVLPDDTGDGGGIDLYVARDSAGKSLQSVLRMGWGFLNCL